jgi:hypothetical protein
MMLIATGIAGILGLILGWFFFWFKVSGGAKWGLYVALLTPTVTLGLYFLAKTSLEAEDRANTPKTWSGL